MKVYFSIEDFSKLNKAVTTTGSFDGVHLGHKKIIKRLIESANESNSESVIVTFWPHPKSILNPESSIKLLTTLEEKIENIGLINPDHLLIIPFNSQFANLTSEEFIQEILVNSIGTKKLILGYDHRFGKNREGSFEYLMGNSYKFGFEVEEIAKEDIDNITISSTNIRKSLETGDPEGATVLLGRPYSLKGKVVEGDKLGRKLGFPTANISIEEDFKLIPANGVYAVTTEIEDSTYKGMMNIGYRPTVDGKIRKIEVNIFDFNRDIYGNTIKVNFQKYLRDEKKFDSLDDLVNQLNQDKENAIKLLKS